MTKRPDPPVEDRGVFNLMEELSDPRCRCTSLASTASTMTDVTVGTVWRWKPRNGTGVIKTGDGTLVWFHLSTVIGDDVTTITEGMPVEVEIEHIPQGDFTCRAISVRRIV